MIDDIKWLGLVQFMREGNHYEEKYMQIAKNEFVSKKGSFSEILINKIYIKKILLHLSNHDANEVLIQIATN